MTQFQGKGSVMQYGQMIASVRYDLTKTKRLFNRPGATEARSTTDGFIKVTEGQIVFGYMYMLRLENGKEVEFYTSRATNVSDLQPIFAVSVSGDPEK